MKRVEWVKEVTPKLKSNMIVAAEAAYENGCDIHAEATLLLASNCFARAAALAILAEEEFSKSFILRTCAVQGRWDSNVFSSLRKHSNKQGISEAMRNYFDWFTENYRKVMELNRCSFIQCEPAFLPDTAQLEAMKKKAAATFTRPERDYFKQDCFYVSIDEDVRLKSRPNFIDRMLAQQCLDEADKFKVVVEVLAGNTSGLAKWVQSA